MAHVQALVVTDILSAIMRSDTRAVKQAQIYLSAHSHLSISIITRYEILRGLQAKTATTQLAKFNVLCASLNILPINDSIIVKASELYGDLHRQGQLIGDADILIACGLCTKSWRAD